MRFPRSGAEWEGYFTLMNATFGLGDLEAAQGLAGWYIDDPTHHENPDWWIETHKACCLAVLGRDAQALDKLEQILRSPRLASANSLEDSRCFRKYAEDPRHQAVVEHFRARRAELRERLPATLAKFGVSL